MCYHVLTFVKSSLHSHNIMQLNILKAFHKESTYFHNHVDMFSLCKVSVKYVKCAFPFGL